MTHLDTLKAYQELVEAISRENPEISSDPDALGCKVKVQLGLLSGKTAVWTIGKECLYDSYKFNCHFVKNVEQDPEDPYFEVIEIIGRPITLEDALTAIGRSNQRISATYELLDGYLLLHDLCNDGSLMWFPGKTLEWHRDNKPKTIFSLHSLLV